MGWFDAVDAYCERLVPGFGGEPFNMLTGLAFLAVGLFTLRRAPAVADRLAAAALALVGLASAVQHGFALGVTVKADQGANLLYLTLLGTLMLRRLAGAGFASALAGGVAVVALTQVVGGNPAVQQALGRASDTFFLLMLVLLGAALSLRATHPATAGRIAFAGAVLAAGLPFRFLDASLCPSWPLGTHGIWHLVNATSAALLLSALARHATLPARALAKDGAGR